MSKYLQYYKDIFDGKPFLRDGKETSLREKPFLMAEVLE